MNKSLFIGLMLGLSLMVFGGAKWDLGKTGAYSKSFEMTCGTTAAPIVTSGVTSYTYLECYNTNTTPIYVGGSGVTTAAGYPVCSDPAACGRNVISRGVTLEYCIVASGTVAMRCEAIIE